MKSALLYNLYPVGDWKSITKKLISDIPHDEIIIHVSLDRYQYLFWKFIEKELKSYSKVSRLLRSKNVRNLGETIGFGKLKECIKPGKYSLVTYFHSKGVTKPKNENIQDWVEMMRYFHIDKFELCQQKFAEGYHLYGVNLGSYSNGERYGPYQFSDFHYSGNFVSVNLDLIGDRFFEMPCDPDYFGVEGFWGKLTTLDKSFCAHLSSENIKNHYLEPYPPELYTS